MTLHSRRPGYRPTSEGDCLAGALALVAIGVGVGVGVELFGPYSDLTSWYPWLGLMAGFALGLAVWVTRPTDPE